MTNTDKYLQRYAEPEVRSLSNFHSDSGYKNTLVIPVYNESDEFLSAFINSCLSKEKVLLIVVINQPSNCIDSQYQIALNDKIITFGQLQWQCNNLSLIQLSGVHADILIVDRFSETYEIPEKQGVGLARKIGADIATALINKNIIKSPWICSTDADAVLPDNYFSILANLPRNISAVIYDFKHINNHDALSAATQRYEKALRYYVSGLEWAGSNYAFHTIGSTLAFRYNYYSEVRGFPKRNAGEDFYLLNKLAKLADIKNLHESTIKIKPRLSNRVPFGTGPAVTRILALNKPTDYRYYHPQLFKELKNCLEAFNNFSENRGDFQNWYLALSGPIQFGLDKLRFDRLVEHLSRQKSDKHQTILQIQQWFDAFRTLKFIHYLQESTYPPIPLDQAIEMQRLNTK